MPDTLITKPLTVQAVKKSDGYTEWSIKVNLRGGGSRYYRVPLDPDEVFGEYNMGRWIHDLARYHDFPFRIQWRKAGTPGLLLHSEMMWGPDDGTEEAGSSFAGYNANTVEAEPTSAIERALVMVLEKPGETVAALTTMWDAIRVNSTVRDKLMITAAIAEGDKQRASLVAAQVEQILNQKAIEGGYEFDDEDGEIIEDVEELEHPHEGHTADSIKESLNLEHRRDDAERSYRQAAAALEAAQATIQEAAALRVKLAAETEEAPAFIAPLRHGQIKTVDEVAADVLAEGAPEAHSGSSEPDPDSEPEKETEPAEVRA